MLTKTQRQELGRLQPWFRIADPIPRPYHPYLYKWLTGSETTSPGPTHQAPGGSTEYDRPRVDICEARLRLADACWKQYRKGESPYTLANLPLLMACAAEAVAKDLPRRRKYWRNFETVAKDYEFANRGQSGSYRQWHRFEHRGWERAFEAWLRYLKDLKGGQRKAQLKILQQYFSGFWWWGEYINGWGACDTYKDLLESTELRNNRKTLPEALQLFEDNWQDNEPARAEDKWARIAAALHEIHAFCGIPEPGAVDLPIATTEDLPVEADNEVLTIALITDIYLGQCYATSDPGQAKRHFARAFRLVRQEGHLEDVQWFAAWIYDRQAQTYLARGESPEAAAECLSGLRAVVHPDHEVKANLFHTWANALWELGEHEQALRADQWAVLYAYRFQAMPHPGDQYTAKFYQEACEWAADRLTRLPLNDRRKWAERLHAHFQPYWQITGEPPYPPSAAEPGDEEARQAWCRYLAPPAPEPLEVRLARDDPRNAQLYAQHAKKVLTLHALAMADYYRSLPEPDWEKAVQCSTIAFFRYFRLLFEPYCPRDEQSAQIFDQLGQRVVDLLLEAYKSVPEATCQLCEWVRKCWPEANLPKRQLELRCYLGEGAKDKLTQYLLRPWPPSPHSPEFVKQAHILAEAGEKLGAAETELEITCIQQGRPDPLDLHFPSLDR
jgi:hypothetical protein